MDTSTSVDMHHEPHAHEAGHEHHELGFWRKYIFSTDHKVIGIQYGLCGLTFLFFGFCLMMMMRWQLAYPGQAMPVIGKWLPYIFGADSMPGGKMTPDFYNSLGAMHGTIMPSCSRMYSVRAMPTPCSADSEPLNCRTRAEV